MESRDTGLDAGPGPSYCLDLLLTCIAVCVHRVTIHVVALTKVIKAFMQCHSEPFFFFNVYLMGFCATHVKMRTPSVWGSNLGPTSIRHRKLSPTLMIYRNSVQATETQVMCLIRV